MNPVMQMWKGCERDLFFGVSYSTYTGAAWHYKNMELYDTMYWILDTRTNEYETRAMAQCTKRPMMISPGSTATKLSNDVVVLFGVGHDNTGHMPKSITLCINILNFTCVQFENTGTEQPSHRFGHVAMQIDDMNLLIYGGTEKNTIRFLSDIWVLLFEDLGRCRGAWKRLESPRSLLGPELPSLEMGLATRVNNLHFVISTHGSKCYDHLLALDTSDYKNTGIVKIHQIPVTGATPCPLITEGADLVKYNENSLLIFGGIGKWISQAQLILLNFSNLQAPAKVMPFVFQGEQTILNGHHIVRGEHLYVFSGKAEGSSRGDYLTIQEGLCPLGYYLNDNMNCQPCPKSFFAPALRGGCRPCPEFTTTLAEGSAACITLSPCHGQACNGHGMCVVKELIAMCQCDFGYVSHDNCGFPLVIAAIVTAILLLLLVIGFAVRKYYKRSQQLKVKEIELRDKHKSMRLYQKKLDQINKGARIQWSSLHCTKKLARGAFSQVWLAEFSDMLVAVKVLPKFTGRNITQTDQFVQEAEVLRSIRHPNIVIFLGAGNDHSSKRPFLVMEYLRRGSLYHVLHDRDNVFTHHDRLRFALDTARGMAYLHGSNPPRLHRDLKSPNLLVSDKWVVKIGDLGTSRFMAILDEENSAGGIATTDPQSSQTEIAAIQPNISNTADISRPTAGAPIRRRDSQCTLTLSESLETSLSTPLLTDVSTRHGETYLHYSASVMTRGVGTLRWKSPETVRGEHYNEKADVYSYGVVVWEIFTRETPYGHLKRSSDVEKAIEKGHQLPLVPGMPYDYRHLAEACLRPEAAARPCFKEIVHDLEVQQENA
ncbi:uncharacterized protein LOC135829672 [Sycon ciliatum]|uniref:uncharacterized protein LOC135829672 n=1 Tax=Sycon ciliatum TaxID=27933 RepID=UPI0031F6AA50